jgi:hypothetical protein
MQSVVGVGAGVGDGVGVGDGDGVGVGVGVGRSGPSTKTVALFGNTITSFGSSEKYKRPNSLVTPKSKSFVTSGSAGGPKATGDATSLPRLVLFKPKKVPLFGRSQARRYWRRDW